MKDIKRRALLKPTFNNQILAKFEYRTKGGNNDAHATDIWHPNKGELYTSQA